VITASAFRTYHTPLNSQPDFINALKAARQFAESASQELGMQVGHAVWQAVEVDCVFST
jgi:Niemann-Pick C1 protein